MQVLSRVVELNQAVAELKFCSEIREQGAILGNGH